MDMYEDFSNWSMADLRRRVELVQDFDRACDLLREGFLYLLQNYAAQEYTEVQRIPRRTMQPIGLDLMTVKF